jgi:hypothetical protein
MLILRNNPNGGPKLKLNSFPLHQDGQGNFGYLLGYDREGEKILVPLSLAEAFADQFGRNISGSKKLLQSFKPRRTFKEWLFLKLFSKKTMYELREQFEDEIKGD